MSDSLIDDKSKKYRWEYYHDRSVVNCKDSDGVIQAQAMCQSEDTAKLFCRVLNDNRKVENIL